MRTAGRSRLAARLTRGLALGLLACLAAMGQPTPAARAQSGANQAGIVVRHGDGRLFLVFGDKTNGKETYGGGRFLYTDPPQNGRVELDFNRAYNPPCVFSHYATCPLPPPGNKLPLPILAGEKKFVAPHAS